jgi:hypothetical protein
VSNPWGTAKSESEAEAVFSKRYPAVHEYLSQYKERLRSRSDQGKFWWELRSCTYHSEFRRPKIVWAKYGVDPAFSYDTEAFFCTNTVFMIPTAQSLLIGLLNSSLVQWFAKHTFNVVQGGYVEWTPTNVAKIPLPTMPDVKRDAIEDLVGKLLDAEGKGPQVHEWERELNALVYEVYGLTEEEIAIVEEETASDSGSTR